MIRSSWHRSLLAAAVFLALPAMAVAHPHESWDEIRLALYQWASGLLNDDPELVDGVLSASVELPGGQSREAYLATVRRGVDVSQIDLRRATHEPIDGGVRVAPVLQALDDGTFALAVSVVLAREDGAWKIRSLQPVRGGPAQLVERPQPEHEATRPVSFSLRDADSGRPVFGRVHITDSQGLYWPARGHQRNIRIGWREDVGGDVRIEDKTYAYVGPDFVADLPTGAFTIEAVKGLEYEPAVTSFTVGESEPPNVEVQLERWIDMAAAGWTSGDTHTHFLDEDSALLELRAEDLNVINVLATKWGELITNAQQVTGAPSPVSIQGGIVYFNEESRHNWLGHTILHPLRELVYPLSWGGPTEGVPGGFDFPPMAHQADKAHAQGGAVTWAHFPFPGGELAVDVALGKIDSIDLFTWGDAFEGGPPTPNGALPSAAEWWYKFLNTGSRLPATAGTDKMLNTQVVGSVRTYVYLGGQELDYQSWIEAIRQGCTFVTTGPMISLTANGEPIGSTLELEAGETVELVAEVRAPYDRYPVDVLELVSGGRVIAVKRNDSGQSVLSLEASLEVGDSSTWVAARARGSKLLPYQAWDILGERGIPPMAHTSPIYVMVEDRPMWSEEDAKFLSSSIDVAIEWARSEARFLRPEERDEMVSLFEEARKIYAGQ